MDPRIIYKPTHFWLGQWRPLRRKLTAGKQLGDGTEEWNGGDRCTGTWHKSVMQGEGICFYTSSNRFQGSFANDQLNGEGSFITTSTEIFMLGPGVCFDAEGDAVPAEFRGGLRAS